MTIVFCDLTGSTAMGEQLDPDAAASKSPCTPIAMATRGERPGATDDRSMADFGLHGGKSS